MDDLFDHQSDDDEGGESDDARGVIESEHTAVAGPAPSARHKSSACAACGGAIDVAQAASGLSSIRACVRCGAVQTESELWKSSGYQDNVSQNYLAYSRQSGLSVSAGVAPRSGGSSKEFVSIEERRQRRRRKVLHATVSEMQLAGLLGSFNNRDVDQVDHWAELYLLPRARYDNKSLRCVLAVAIYFLTRRTRERRLITVPELVSFLQAPGAPTSVVRIHRLMQSMLSALRIGFESSGPADSSGLSAGHGSSSLSFALRLCDDLEKAELIPHSCMPKLKQFASNAVSFAHQIGIFAGKNPRGCAVAAVQLAVRSALLPDADAPTIDSLSSMMQISVRTAELRLRELCTVIADINMRLPWRIDSASTAARSVIIEDDLPFLLGNLTWLQDFMQSAVDPAALPSTIASSTGVAVQPLQLDSEPAVSIQSDDTEGSKKARPSSGKRAASRPLVPISLNGIRTSLVASPPTVSAPETLPKPPPTQSAAAETPRIGISAASSFWQDRAGQGSQGTFVLTSFSARRDVQHVAPSPALSSTPAPINSAVFQSYFHSPALTSSRTPRLTIAAGPAPSPMPRRTPLQSSATPTVVPAFSPQLLGASSASVDALQMTQPQTVSIRPVERSMTQASSPSRPSHGSLFASINSPRAPKRPRLAAQ